MQSVINGFFKGFNDFYTPIVFWKLPIIDIPVILFILLAGGIFFTLRFGMINLRLFKHAFLVIAGKFDDPNDPGEISHFQALTSALSATVGLGNIAGVAVAIALGEAGAVFWLWIAAFFGMSMKFSSCTLAQIYRRKDSSGNILGGPMVYLEEGLKDLGLPKMGKFLGVLFACITIISSFGIGNLFQSNQTYEVIKGVFPATNPWLIGITLALLSAIVLVGGIKRIGVVTAKLVPLMVCFYLISCFAILFNNSSIVFETFLSVFKQAFSPDAMFGGFIGVLIQGIKRGCFSNEAGLGSAAIAHAVAKTKEPVREGVVAMIGPFIDTHIICTITALTILVTGAHLDPELSGKGVLITTKAFSTLGPWMPYLLIIAICTFAYSTIISWSYYGERATEYLFGKSIGSKGVLIYRIIYVSVVSLGPVLSLSAVIDFSDILLLSMAVPNIFGMVLLSKIVKKRIAEYYIVIKE